MIATVRPLFRPLLVVPSVVTALSAAPAPVPEVPAARGGPNFIFILIDDAGYGDLGCFGSTAIRTPRLDTLAREGMKLTSFCAQPVCGPSRGALMTGRYPNRIGGGWYTEGSEVTIAEVLKGAGYATACIGKWDMSGRKPTPGLGPNDQGFDYYFGTLGATDSGRVQLYRNREPVGENRDMGSLTMLVTDEALAFLAQNQHAPFFLYLSYNMPHARIGASPRFRGQSAGGLYGDVIEELDFNIGRVIDRVKDLNLDRDTVVVFTSDNGPWLPLRSIGEAGSAGPLRNGKGSAWEGGFRVPGIVWGPGRVPAGVVSDELVSTLDILPTFAAMAGARLPADRAMDGRDQAAFFTGRTAKSARDTFYYYVRGNLHAVRHGKWKLALPGRKNFAKWAPDNPPVTAPQLYDLEADISEKQDVAVQHPEIVRELQAIAADARRDLGDLQELPLDIPGVRPRF